jgi:hypothetical protein
MPTVKLCTFSKSFYPVVWGQKQRVMIGAYLILKDGKIIKRGFRDTHEYQMEYPLESEAMQVGLDWIIANVEDLRDTNLQVFFCGAGRNELKKMVDDGTFFGYSNEEMKIRHPHGFHGNEKILSMFNKITYHTASRVVINDGDGDDRAEPFDIYSVASKYFTLLYGDDINYGHKVHETVDDDKFVSGKRTTLVGIPELRWRNGTPISEWT